MAEKQHPPSQRRLRDLRKRGEVVTSHDVTATVVFLGVIASLWVLGPKLYELQHSLLTHALSPEAFRDPGEQLPQVLQHGVMVLLWALIPIVLVALFCAIAGAFAQVGGMLAWARINPDMKRLNPAEGLKRMFAMRNLINLVKMILKTLLLGTLIFVVIRSSLDTAIRAGYSDVFGVLQVGASLVMLVCGWAAVIYLVMAAVDYVHVRYEFMKQNRMSTDEVRREHKDTEGDPILLGRRRAAQQEAAYAGLIDRVGAASAVIHSPRIALAIQYRGAKDLPRVIARGEGHIAAQIRRYAKAGLIPMAEDADLASRLYQEVMLDRPIPRHLYRRVAILLRWAQGK